MQRISIITAVGLVIIIAVGIFAALEFYQSITIEIDGDTQTVMTWASTVGDVLSVAGIQVTEGDLVVPPIEERLPDAGQLSINRAFWVLITADGETQSLWTTKHLPHNLLKEAGVKLYPNDLLLWNGFPIAVEARLPTALSHSIQIQRASSVVVNKDDQKQHFFSTAGTLGSSLWEQGIILSNIDHIEPSFDSTFTGQEVAAEIQKTRTITIQQAGDDIQIQTLAKTVSEALTQAALPLQGLDFSIPSEDSPIPITNTIRLVRVHEAVSLQTDPLPFGFLTQPLEDFELDTQQVVQVGEFGLIVKRQRLVYEDGIEVSRTTEDEWVAKEPKPRIVGYGTKINIRTLQTPEGPIEYWRAVEVYGSTYSPCRSGGDKCYPNTSSGKPVQKGVIAVTLDWYRYMQGLPAYVPNYGFGTIEDVGGGLPDRHWIDLGYSDEDWVGWGGWMTIYFLTPVPSNIMWILE